jgi:formate hydrogenlyase subunit 3/multisubunit Na+/H+ antiporter MnhD subunit
MNEAFLLSELAASLGPSLLILSLATPLALLAACLSQNMRRDVILALPLGPLPALAAAALALAGGPFAAALPPLRMSFALDTPGAMLLLVCALLWIGAGAYAAADLRGKPDAARFALCWLLTLIGNLGVFIAADLLTFYLVYALVSIPAFGLIAHEDTAETARAGGVYMAFTILGEACLLMAFALLAAGEPHHSLAIGDVMASLPESPWRDAAVALAIVGFGMKIALVPLHGWMPLTYTAAPIPAAAVLSGAAVKAGVIGLIRFLPFDIAMAGWGEALAAVGFLSAFYGVAIGITQRNPKTVLAYSSISQMGVIAAVVGMGLAAGDASAPLGAAFYAANHVLVKGALFLAVGVAAVSNRRALWLPLAVVLALSLGGLPFTGGALAKYAVKAQLGEGLVGLLATLSSIGTTLLMLHFVRRLLHDADASGRLRAPLAIAVPWVAIALTALIVPWLLLPAFDADVWGALTPSGLWEALWPVLVGALLAIPIWRYGGNLPRVPAGDVVGAEEQAFRASLSLGGAFDGIDGLLRQWPAAALSLAALVIAFAAALLAAR